jgi:hypothetical protein
MPFVSPTFLFAFLPAVLLAWWPCRKRPNGGPVLLIASLFFYAWGQGVWVTLLIFSIFVNYALGIWIQRSRGGTGGRAAMATAVVINLAPLVALKYSTFVITNLGRFLQFFGGPSLDSVSPLPSWVPPRRRRCQSVCRSSIRAYPSLLPPRIAGCSIGLTAGGMLKLYAGGLGIWVEQGGR